MLFFNYLFSRNRLGDYIFNQAKKNNIKPEILAGLIYQESKGEIYAFKFEKAWKEKLATFSRDKLKKYGYVPSFVPSLEDEKRARSTSFGLTQVLGQTAREQGFRQQYLSGLFEPYTNVNWGIKILKDKERAARRKIKTFDEEKILEQTLLFYNGGGDADYPNKIYQHIETGRYEEILKL